ncbi:MAG: M23 family metallopeptidase [Rhizobiaceae bacterium]|nr:M23 family metallopeptidase [Rhizobiaceae bacterium]
MQGTERTKEELGDQAPLVADGRAVPDRREISARWLSGTFLTGVTSSVLMGVALFAALDGREQLATPPEIMKLIAAVGDGQSGEKAKATRVSQTRQITRAKDIRRMEVSTMSRVGDREVVRAMPFVQIRMALGANHKTTRKYPGFDPLSVFAEDGAAPTTASSIVFDAKVESEMSLKTVDFPIETAAFDEQADLTAEEVENVVRSTGAVLTEGSVQVAALHYVDPLRFGTSAEDPAQSPYGVRIVQENVSVAPKGTDDENEVVFAEEIIPIVADRSISEALAGSGYEGEDAAAMSEAIGKLLNTGRLKAGTVLRVGLEVSGDRGTIIRTSVYNGKSHVLTIARNDRDQLVPAEELQPSQEVLAAFDDSPPAIRVRSELPSVYDGIYQAAYSYGMSKGMTRQLIKLLASEVDFQSRLNPTDTVEVFFSQPKGESSEDSDDSELLYVASSFAGNTRKLYRFQMADGAIDYFDEDGRSARQFLLRNPLPNGKFRSGFGGRKHPILGYVKMHTGVDWAAPHGTPIIASGNGVVEKAGWAGGYGRQTLIRHANGYETSYNHQSAFAKGITPGARVRQGQIIGYVGSTGLSTGNHLHYELIVNGTKVDPMRVRLPVGRVLKDGELEAFKSERDRIDQLLNDDNEGKLTVASVAR